MGNIGSSSGSARRRHNHHNLDGPIATANAPLPHQQQQRPPPQQPDMTSGNQYVFAAASPYPHQYPNPSPPPFPNAAHPQYPTPAPTPGYYPQYQGYYPSPPPMPAPLPAPFLQHHPHGRPMPLDPHHHHMGWGGGPRYAPPGPMPMPPPPPYIEHQKAVTIRNVVNLKKETLRIEPDEENPGQFLVSFTFDATVPGSITVIFFAKEGFECNLVPMKENLPPPKPRPFEKGLVQKFRQPSGTGIDFSAFEEIELLKEGEMEVYPLVVKAEATPDDDKSNGEYQKASPPNAQITQAVFEKKENGEYHVRVVKQILWVGGVRYELQEIYGIGNSVDNDFDGNDPGKECVICLSEPRDTTVLPCRHMCMCSGCAKLLRLQTNRCPICRQPVERLLEIKVNSKPEEQQAEHPNE